MRKTRLGDSQRQHDDDLFEWGLGALGRRVDHSQRPIRNFVASAFGES